MRANFERRCMSKISQDRFEPALRAAALVLESGCVGVGTLASEANLRGRLWNLPATPLEVEASQSIFYLRRCSVPRCYDTRVSRSACLWLCVQ